MSAVRVRQYATADAGWGSQHRLAERRLITREDFVKEE